MTTAARPTWAPAKGSEEQGGSRMFGPSKKYSSRDMPAHTSLKVRQDGQGTVEELRKKDLREELEDKERKHFLESDDGRLRQYPALQLGAVGGRREVEEKLIPKAIDADESDGGGGETSESEAEDDDEDDTAELYAELERIKNERAQEKLRKEREEAEVAAKEKEQDLVRGNPLLNPGSFAVKRRWDDDVVFKNQARGEPKPAKRFINDTIRSDFHKKFLNKYMK